MSRERRDFIKNMGLAGLGLALAPELAFAKRRAKKKNDGKVRIAFVGLGRGSTHLRNISRRSDVIVPAICDINPGAIKRGQDILAKNGHKKADVYSDSEYAYKDMLARDDIDGVVISTPWLWHVPMSVEAMRQGVFVGVEVSAANTMAECWDLVNTHEATGTPLMIMENVCYRRDVLAVLNMVRNGVFGEVCHARCGYLHDLRHVKFTDGEFGENARGEARWRTQHSLLRNADLYPTHGLGPIATMLDINRGNRFVSLTSTATKAKGLSNFISKTKGKDHKNANLDWKLGDVVTTVIKTANEESIIVTHDTNLPRPYSLGFYVQGVDGLVEFDRGTQRIYVEGESKPHAWEDANKWLEKYDHNMWKSHEAKAKGAGHGGMDYFLDNAFVEAVKYNLAPPLDVYDAASWSAVTPLSERSIANNSEPQYFPDFTRGNWIKRERYFAIDQKENVFN
ncbi:alpha-N-acetylgalactosaminidase [Fulvitalea axinellae]|uniref:Alpha-N-acetylgalactosaminidase n=1 Tax=Fulvitalea axinellae TaxID=1182444 RepID=A0AAU9CWE0_9BACT|nr:alpha-N-acetylgalactosaminidase [Fulvitalea axinellae]